MDAPKLSINVQSSTGKKYPMQIAESATILDMKRELGGQAEVVRTKTFAIANPTRSLTGAQDASRIRLIYKGRVLKDNTTVEDGGEHARCAYFAPLPCCDTSHYCTCRCRGWQHCTHGDRSCEPTSPAGCSCACCCEW